MQIGEVAGRRHDQSEPVTLGLDPRHGVQPGDRRGQASIVALELGRPLGGPRDARVELEHGDLHGNYAHEGEGHDRNPPAPPQQADDQRVIGQGPKRPQREAGQGQRPPNGEAGHSRGPAHGCTGQGDGTPGERGGQGLQRRCEGA